MPLGINAFFTTSSNPRQYLDSTSIIVCGPTKDLICVVVSIIFSWLSAPRRTKSKGLRDSKFNSARSFADPVGMKVVSPYLTDFHVIT
ncbi:hypothetical protein OGATHE_004678 [Ogataea polymorpha]|uniref:Uncharacterized protein n=1 Tax=Ogataea polymorpha TaxID=460523 RepID=A0A9P8P1F5_9ASCO|nr:hypothetical protein OGATHE_004678 [Ogataea polymorpha]